MSLRAFLPWQVSTIANRIISTCSRRSTRTTDIASKSPPVKLRVSTLPITLTRTWLARKTRKPANKLESTETSEESALRMSFPNTNPSQTTVSSRSQDSFLPSKSVRPPSTTCPTAPTALISSLVISQHLSGPGCTDSLFHELVRHAC